MDDRPDTGYAQYLTDHALAERLRLAADSPRRWPIEDRRLIMTEAAYRLSKDT